MINCLYEFRKNSIADRDEQRRVAQEARRRKRADAAWQKRIGELEQRIAEREAEIKRIEETMSAAGFYDNREAAQPIVDRHQDLMWEVGDLMSQWEALQQLDSDADHK